MSRLTIVPVLATLGFLPACAAEVDDGDLGDYEGLQQEVPESDSNPGEEVLATRAAVDPDDDFDPDIDLGDFAADPDTTEAIAPLLPAPRLLCGTEHCFAGGEARRPLRGRDAVRNSYFMIAGYPDIVTYYSHTGSESGPPQIGVWGATVNQINLMNSVLIDAEFDDCGSLPPSAQKSVESGVVRLDTVELRVPERFPEGLKFLDREVTVASPAGDLHGVANFSCTHSTARYSLDFSFDGQEAHVDAWVGGAEDGTEVELLATFGHHRFAAALATSPDGVDGVVVSVHGNGMMDFGWRTVLEADREFASAYMQYLKGLPRLTLAPDAYSIRIDGHEAGASRNCHVMENEGPIVFKAGDCDELPLSTPLDSVFSDGRSYSLGWVSEFGGPSSTFGQ